MASANVDLVRSIHAAFERGDYSSVEWVHPEIEFVIADGPSPGRWTGLAGMAEGWRDWLSAWDEYRVEADEYRELDDERVLVLGHLSGRGKTSGLELGHMPSKAAGLFHIRDGKVTRLVQYFDCERALADLGLPPETGSTGSKARCRKARRAIAPASNRDTSLMGSANVDLVRSIYAPYERGDYSSVEWAHPDIEYVHVGGPLPGNWTGLAGLEEGWRSFLSAWEEFRIVVDEYRELDDERVLVLARYLGRGKTSGLELEQVRAKGAAVFHVRGGRVTRHIVYWDRERALADLGLASQDSPTDS